jgi:hypothetical protein
MISQHASPSHTTLLTNAVSFTTRLGKDRTPITTTLSIGITNGITDGRISAPFGGPSVSMTMQKNPHKTTLQITATILIALLANAILKWVHLSCNRLRDADCDKYRENGEIPRFHVFSPHSGHSASTVVVQKAVGRHVGRQSRNTRPRFDTSSCTYFTLTQTSYNSHRLPAY